MKPQNAEQRYKITLRVNRDLLEEIRLLAQRDHRTMNSYLLNLVQRDINAAQNKKHK